MSSYWLQIQEPGHAPRVETVTGRLDVGRDCEGLLLEDPTVSRRHLYLEPSSEGLVCVDMGSANGTKVDGNRMEGPMALQAGAVISLGETTLTVHEGKDTKQTGDGQGIEVDPKERFSEAKRDLSSAARPTQGQTGRPPA